MVTANLVSYLGSLSDELRVQQTRVRDLIGDAHWGVDGSHKEFLLLSLLTRHLPAGTRTARGFVVTPPAQSSKEQDILIADVRTEGPLFDQGGTVIVLPTQVLALVSVKTTVSKREFEDASNGIRSALDVISLAGDRLPFSAVLFFGGDGQKFADWVEEEIQKPETHFPDLFVSADGIVARVRQSGSDTFVDTYWCEKSAVGMLMASLLNAISQRLGGGSFSAFSEAVSGMHFRHESRQVAGVPVTPPKEK